MATKKASMKAHEQINETSEAIAQQTERFLASGGKIQEIPTGVSGQVSTSGPRHITLGRRKTG